MGLQFFFPKESLKIKLKLNLSVIKVMQRRPLQQISGNEQHFPQPKFTVLNDSPEPSRGGSKNATFTTQQWRLESSSRSPFTTPDRNSSPPVKGKKSTPTLTHAHNDKSNLATIKMQSILIDKLKKENAFLRLALNSSASSSKSVTDDSNAAKANRTANQSVDTSQKPAITPKKRRLESRMNDESKQTLSSSTATTPIKANNVHLTQPSPGAQAIHSNDNDALQAKSVPRASKHASSSLSTPVVPSLRYVQLVINAK